MPLTAAPLLEVSSVDVTVVVPVASSNVVLPASLLELSSVDVTVSGPSVADTVTLRSEAA